MTQPATGSANTPGRAASADDPIQWQIEQASLKLAWLRREITEMEHHQDAKPSTLLQDANEQLMLAVLRTQADVENGARALKSMSRLAQFDGLTELPNRMLLLDRCANAIATTKRRGGHLALIFIDLDHFKQINDTLGHLVGDHVLREVSRRLVKSVRESDTVSRYGGDEFVILLTEVAAPGDVVPIVHKLLTAVNAPFQLDELMLRMSVSVGVSLYPEEGRDADTLIARADAAMYQAKKQGVGNFFFSGKSVPTENSAASPAGAPSPENTHWPVSSAAPPGDALLREANSQLVMTVIGSLELRAAADRAHRKQAEFLAVLAHELRGPLAPIRDAAALLGRRRAEDVPEIQSVIERQVALISRLVEDLLDLSRVATTKLLIERHLLELDHVIDAAVAAAQAALTARSQSLATLIADRALRVHGDQVRLVQIVHSLLDCTSRNAPVGGEISLSVSVVGDRIEIAIADDSIGMSVAATPSGIEAFVQDPRPPDFYRARMDADLALVSELVVAHDGRVTAGSSAAGQGSRFVVSLPRADTAFIAGAACA